jgi:anti-anti-sigma regulatory factor
MFSVEADDAERLIKIRWSGKVDSTEMRTCAEQLAGSLAEVRPGFRILTDMTDLESMDPTGARFLGSIMDLCLEKQVGHVVRVLPEPHKDIGFNIMSYFHYGSKVRVTTCQSLTDAWQLLAE